MTEFEKMRQGEFYDFLDDDCLASYNRAKHLCARLQTMTPGETKLNRPQTPHGSFPYTTEEVSFTNGDVILRGTLVLPEGCSRETPVLLLVTGSGRT